MSLIYNKFKLSSYQNLLRNARADSPIAITVYLEHRLYLRLLDEIVGDSSDPAKYILAMVEKERFAVELEVYEMMEKLRDYLVEARFGQKLREEVILQVQSAMGYYNRFKQMTHRQQAAFVAEHAELSKEEFLKTLQSEANLPSLTIGDHFFTYLYTKKQRIMTAMTSVLAKEIGLCDNFNIEPDTLDFFRIKITENISAVPDPRNFLINELILLMLAAPQYADRAFSQLLLRVSGISIESNTPLLQGIAAQMVTLCCTLCERINGSEVFAFNESSVAPEVQDYLVTQRKQAFNDLLVTVATLISQLVATSSKATKFFTNKRNSASIQNTAKVASILDERKSPDLLFINGLYGFVKLHELFGYFNVGYLPSTEKANHHLALLHQCGEKLKAAIAKEFYSYTLFNVSREGLEEEQSNLVAILKESLFCTDNSAKELVETTQVFLAQEGLRLMARI